MFAHSHVDTPAKKKEIDQEPIEVRNETPVESDNTKQVSFNY